MEEERIKERENREWMVEKKKKGWREYLIRKPKFDTKNKRGAVRKERDGRGEQE